MAGEYLSDEAVHARGKLLKYRFEICQCVDEQAAFKDEIVLIVRGSQLAQKFFLEEKLQTLLITDSAFLCFVFELSENRSRDICHYSHTPIMFFAGAVHRSFDAYSISLGMFFDVSPI